jgi:hypothetical protein
MSPTATESPPAQKAVVLSVRPDPEPCEGVIFQKSESTISERHADGIDGIVTVDLLEVKAVGC